MSRFRAYSVLFTLASVSACAPSSPQERGDEQPSDGKEGASTTTPPTVNESAKNPGPSPQPEAISPGVPAAKSPPKQGVESFPGPTSTSSTALSAQDKLRRLLAEYCNTGALSCFMMDSIEDGKMRDRGRLGLDIHTEKSTVVATQAKRYPFSFALQLHEDPRPQSDKEVPLPKNGIVGFDVWIKPNSPGNTGWNAVGLEGFLSLRKIAPGYIECAYNVGLSGDLPTIPRPVSLSVPFDFPPDRFVHVGCALHGQNVSMWIDGIEHLGPQRNRLLLPKSSSYLLNWKSAFESPFTGQLGPMRVWHDTELMTSEIRRLHLLLPTID